MTQHTDYGKRELWSYLCYRMEAADQDGLLRSRLSYCSVLAGSDADTYIGREFRRIAPKEVVYVYSAVCRRPD